MRNMPPREERQTLMFSATFKPDIQKLAAEFLREYVWVGVGRVGSTVENIKQVIKLASADVFEKLRITMEAIQETSGQTLVFVQKKRTASWLCETLRYQYQLRVDEIHSDKSQGQREASLRRFRDGQIRVLVGTDVAARGLDIANVGHVIQFDLPFTSDEFDAYIHRMGRTGRAGHSGLATSLFVPGTANGEGNGRVAPLIMQLLEENNQEIPDWFKEVHDTQLVAGKRGKKGGNKFSSRDVRVPYGQKQQMQYVGGNRGQQGQQQGAAGGGYMRGGQHGGQGQGQGGYNNMRGNNGGRFQQHPQQHSHHQHQHQHHQQRHQQHHHQQQQQQHMSGYMGQPGQGQGYTMPHPSMQMDPGQQMGGYHQGQMMGQQMGYPPHPNYPPSAQGGHGMQGSPDGSGQMAYPPQQGQGQGQGQPPGQGQGGGGGEDHSSPSKDQSGSQEDTSSPATGGGVDSPGSTSLKTKRPPSLEIQQGYAQGQGGMAPMNGNMNMTPGNYGMPVHFMPPSPSPGAYAHPSPHFMMPPNANGYNYSPRTYNPSITSPSHMMPQMRVDAPTFVPGYPEDGTQGGGGGGATGGASGGY